MSCICGIGRGWRYLLLPPRLHEIFDMLNNQLQHRHSSMLEMIIIGLIAFEIVLSLLRTSLGI